MNTPELSLVHLVRKPLKSSQLPPPLLLLLHGIGSNEADLFGLAPFLDERFLIVSARAPVTMGAGAYGWFNIEFTEQGMVADIEQAEESLNLLPGFLDELVSHYGVNEKCVYVAGFSQGAMMSLALALNWPERIAGVVAMSGRFPSRVLKSALDEKALEGLPFMVTHGIYDPVLPIEQGRVVRESLKALPVEVTYREYPMGHEVNQESLRDVTAWLSRTLDLTCDH
jgi:phospholipase/carboxylesterase